MTTASAYVLASYVGYTRVEARDHYLHDVLAGAALGYASSHFFTEPYPGWRIQAEAGDRYLGVGIHGSW